MNIATAGGDEAAMLLEWWVVKDSNRARQSLTWDKIRAVATAGGDEAAMLLEWWVVKDSNLRPKD